ncbi:MAG: von Willebrand factor type A domain-containing protein [Bacteroidetes bacterium]|nr:von Willebrand factor type A domain-containing protein [Bacteroidota bacterium]
MKKVLLLLTPVLAFLWAFSPTLSFKISGKITDAQGNGLGGVTVKIKGASTATTSVSDGTYNIEAPNEKGELVFSSVGYQVKTEKINSRSVINVVLKASEQLLQEVVVTGLGVQTRKSVTANVSSVRADSYNYTPYTVADEKKPVYERLEEDKDDFNTEGYDYITENRFLKVSDNPLSTFSIDVDAASYSNVRRFLNMGQMPPAGAVRIEEMINYFHYEYPAPKEDQPFSVTTEISDCPWNKDNKLVLVGLQGRKIPTDNLPASNLVFLIDVSGSMQEPQKLPLVQASLKMLTDQLREKDHVAMVVYAGAAGLVLPSTNGNEKTKIKDAIDKLEAGGSTAGGAGIKLAYKTAKESFIKGGNNRVILCTDGDFNVGASSDDDMERLIEEERKSGVFLTILGYGMGNYKDSKMQKLADKGNGNHAYIDGISEAKKVLVNEFGGTMFTIAKDVKLQVEFNPVKVKGYRLLGYENRMLNKEDFNNDKNDAGDMGSGHTVTALYEVIPVGVESNLLESVDPLKYQSPKKEIANASHNGEIMNIKLRYKQPDADVSRLLEHPVFDNQAAIAKTSDNFRFAAAVAQFGMLLRNSEFKSNSSFSNVLKLAKNAKGNDEEGYRSEFIRLVESAQSLATNNKNEPAEDVSVVNNN